MMEERKQNEKLVKVEMIELTEEEKEQITDGLNGILKDVESGKLEISDKYEDIKSSYSSRMYWLNPFCFIAKRSLSNSPMVTICLPITVFPFSLFVEQVFPVCKTIERTVNGRNEMTLTQVLQTGETTGNSTWDGNQYVDFHLEFYILFRFSHGKELL